MIPIMYYSFTVTDEKVIITNVNNNVFTNDIEMNSNPKLFDATKILPVLDESLNYTIINSLRSQGMHILNSEITSFVSSMESVAKLQVYY